jgi:hypothetical protein
MASRQITRLRPSTLLVIIVVIIFFGFFYDLNGDGYSRRAPKKTSPGLHAGTSTRHPDFDNLLLDQRECEAVFPDLTKGIDAVTEIGPFKFEFRNSVAFQAKIENDQVRRPFFQPLSIQERRPSPPLNLLLPLTRLYILAVYPQGPQERRCLVHYAPPAVRQRAANLPRHQDVA